MKLLAYFNTFLANTVNLNETKLDQLDSSFEAIKKFLRDSDYKPSIGKFYKHGSWAHRTIIRPIDGRPFDADVIAFLKPVEGWSAADYIENLALVFRNSARYKDKVKTYSHCVTIEYAGERKMDIAPCVIGREMDDIHEVCNADLDEFQLTKPKEYTAWLNSKNGYSGLNSFRKVTRLLKFIRDYKRTFTCPSFLLTTLLGERINFSDKDTDFFRDVPTALKTVVARLDDWLQATAYPPYVPNPVLTAESQASAWTEAQYSNFREVIHRYREWIDDAYNEEDVAASLSKWRRIFGDNFGEVRKAEVVSTEVLAKDALVVDDAVDIARKSGLKPIPPAILEPVHKAPPQWPVVLIAQQVTVTAALDGVANHKGMSVENGEPVEAHQGIRFRAMLGGVVPGTMYRTMWRVTNTGEAARHAGALRGGFVASDVPHSRWEHLEYRGIHQVEAYIVRESDSILVGFSKPFYVVIE
ncbi:SMODS domain-containing nucleotidyltransferase [Xanthomonas translucens]|uniref:SMODS domain-containing nucleotidyltransferase n=1 Tax=Xanthomonas campestris pv. translucens TaxID=343 RepID=UPI0009BD3EF5|nr:nucleotidyltransferase [Xanthomonas translucens]QEO24846.1 nucleotidyltransferase [Xanthomonas translucens pv. undulosa]